MNKKFNFKKIAAGCALAAGAVGIPAIMLGDEIVKVIGKDDKVIGSYSAGSVSYIEFAEGNIAEVTADSIVIPLSDAVKFTMIKVEGGVPFTLTNQGTPLTAGAWADGGATKQIEDFWIGKFAVTQGVWKEVMGVTDNELPVSNYEAGTANPIGTKQTAFGNDFPIANVSWDDICTGDTSFLTKINTRLKELKATNPALAAALGDREFRLPNEWEWAYAAAGGKNYKTLNYYFSGTTENTPEALQEVAVNSVPSNSATSVAKVGSKAPNALGLYDMAGNVWERCSGLGYPGHEETPGYLMYDGILNDSHRPSLGGCFLNDTKDIFRISFRNSLSNTGNRSASSGFRLAL